MQLTPDAQQMVALEAYLASLPEVERARYVRLSKRYAEKSLISRGCDPRLLALPHPQRIEAFDLANTESEMFKRYAPNVWAAACNLDAGRFELLRIFLRDYPLLAQVVSNGRTEILNDIALRLMVKAGRARQIQTTDALEEMLGRTDFGEDVPCNWFRTPFPGIYIEFGTKRDFPIAMHHPDSGDHVIEGCYLFEGNVFRDGASPGDNLLRGYDIIIYGSAAGKESPLDDVYIHMAIAIEDENEPISALVARSIDQFRKKAGHVPNDHVFQPVVEHVAKILVYLNMSEARRVEVNEGSEARRRISALRSAAKIEKAIRQSARLYDRIVVGPTAPPAPNNDHAGTGEMRAHWRRGHIRAQAYGPQHSLRRPVWIHPLLVRADKLGERPISAQSYLVKE